MPRATILDQPEEIEKVDRSNMLNHCLNFPDYSKDAIKRAERVEIPKEVKISDKTSITYTTPKNILILGMGGSAIGGELLRGWLRDTLPVPVDICRDHNLPAYANKDTLVMAISYSGETVETLSAFVDAIRRRCMTITVTSGGHLLTFSKKLNIPHVSVPQNFPPRAAFPYLFFPLPILLTKMKIIPDTRPSAEEALNTLKSIAEENAPRIPIENNPSKKLALELKETIPVVYGSGFYEAVAHRMKTQFNENSKLPSSYDVFPELSHNEIVGWEASDNLTRGFFIILLRDRDDPPEVNHKIELTKALVSRKVRKVHEIYARGTSRIAKMLSLVVFGDFLSVYLAIALAIDPSPVKSIQTVKRGMKERFDLTAKLRDEIDNMLS